MPLGQVVAALMDTVVIICISTVLDDSTSRGSIDGKRVYSLLAKLSFVWQEGVIYTANELGFRWIDCTAGCYCQLDSSRDVH